MSTPAPLTNPAQPRSKGPSTGLLVLAVLVVTTLVGWLAFGWWALAPVAVVAAGAGVTYAARHVRRTTPRRARSRRPARRERTRGLIEPRRAQGTRTTPPATRGGSASRRSSTARPGSGSRRSTGASRPTSPARRSGGSSRRSAASTSLVAGGWVRVPGPAAAQRVHGQQESFAAVRVDDGRHERLALPRHGRDR